jgi:riboflavin synthase
MFTGIIEDIATVRSVTKNGDVLALQVFTTLDLAQTRLGDSIAVNGVCLTATAIKPVHRGFDVGFDVAPESARVTALGSIQAGTHVHLERALAMGGRLDGHLVQGHVDGIGYINEVTPFEKTLRLSIRAPQSVLALCIVKGSIAIDGVSLTINEIFAQDFSVWLVPHTLERTHLGKRNPGDQVNLENDLIGKYVQRLMLAGQPTSTTTDGVTWDLLERSGFAAKR